ncbi:MAG: biopolymer transporter ExbD [Spirochaetota bacterium]|nr:biopolymer transporter ExbD [Spirochaetota bacterium]
MIDFKTKLQSKVHIDFTPLVDVIFILLIFFILSYNEVKIRGHKIHLPEDKTANTTQLKKEDPIIITALKNGKTYLQGMEIDIQDIANQLKKLVKNKLKLPDIIISAEGNVEIQTLISLIDAIKLAGIKKAPLLHTQQKHDAK